MATRRWTRNYLQIRSRILERQQFEQNDTSTPEYLHDNRRRKSSFNNQIEMEEEDPEDINGIGHIEVEEEEEDDLDEESFVNQHEEKWSMKYKQIKHSLRLIESKSLFLCFFETNFHFQKI